MQFRTLFNNIKKFTLLTLFLSNCDTSTNFEDFKNSSNISKIKFKEDFKECQKEGQLQGMRSEGSKRAGEIILDKKYYSMNCMKRKGWNLKDN